MRTWAQINGGEPSDSIQLNSMQLNEQDMSKHEATKLSNTRPKASFVLQPTTIQCYTLLVVSDI